MNRNNISARWSSEISAWVETDHVIRPLQILSFHQLSVEVSLVTIPPKRSIESFFTNSSKGSCQYIENHETAADEGEVVGGGRGS